MAGTTNYPGAVDSTVTIPGTLAGPPTHKQVHEDNRVAIIALQTELGVNGRHRTFRNYTSTTTRDAANPSPLSGHVCWLEASDSISVYDGAAWWNWNRIQRGTTSNSASSSIAVLFGTSFARAPVVVASIRTTLNINVTISSVTTGDFQANLFDADSGVPYTGSVFIDWIAIET